MMEMIVCVIIIAILAAFGVPVMGKTITSARNRTKEYNAKTMNQMVSEIRSLGGTVGEGSDNDLDISNIDTLIDGLSSEPYLDIEGITFGISPAPNPKSYRLVGMATNKKVEVIEGLTARP